MANLKQSSLPGFNIQDLFFASTQIDAFRFRLAVTL
jgi:hypothetical protein